MGEKVTIAGREFDVGVLAGDKREIVNFLVMLGEHGVIVSPEEQRVVQAMRDLRHGGELTVRRNGREQSDVSFFLEVKEMHLLMAKPPQYECKAHGRTQLPFCPACSEPLRPLATR